MKSISTGSLTSLARFLYTQRVKGFELPLEPHLDDVTLPLFGQMLRTCTFYVEYGAGGSTVFANRLGVRGISVDVDRYYAATVRSALGINPSLQVAAVDVGVTRQWGKPIILRRSRRRLARWARYARAPFEIMAAGNHECFPDFVLVDGRFRRACALNLALHASASEREVALLFDDYYEPNRQHYWSVESFLGKPERYGRAALFHNSPTAMVRRPQPEDILKANMDFR